MICTLLYDDDDECKNNENHRPERVLIGTSHNIRTFYIFTNCYINDLAQRIHPWRKSKCIEINYINFSQLKRYYVLATHSPYYYTLDVYTTL